MKKTLVLFLILACGFSGAGFAQEKASFDEKVIGMAFRAVMRVYVVTCDIEGLKRNNINKVKEMSEEAFAAKRDRVYDLAKDLPVPLKSEYAITPDITRDQVIKDITMLDKKRAYALVDALPDSALARMFKRARGRNAVASGGDASKHADAFWEGVVDRIDKP